MSEFKTGKCSIDISIPIEYVENGKLSKDFFKNLEDFGAKLMEMKVEEKQITVSLTFEMLEKMIRFLAFLDSISKEV